MLSSHSPYTPVETGEISAPLNNLDASKPEVKCSVCHVTAYETFEGSNNFVNTDGDRLKGAQRTPKGWACSKKCLSQAMFEAGSDQEKKSLKRLEIALQEIDLNMSVLRDLFNSWIGNKSQYFLGAAAEDYRDAIGFFETPMWVKENKSREELLATAIFSAVRDLEWRPINNLRARMLCAFDHPTLFPNPSRDAETLASIANIVVRLKDVLEGGAR